MSHKGVIIFDFDGVICDSMDLMLEMKQLMFDDFEWKNIQEDHHKRSMHTAVTEHAHVMKISEEESKRLWNEVYTPKKKLAKIYPHIKEVLEHLSKDRILVINTFARRSTCVPILERNDILSYFKQVYAYEDGTSKVKKNEAILQNYGVSANDCIFVTDSTGDVLDGVQSAIRSIGVTWGIHDSEHFADVDGDWVFGVAKEPAEISTLVDSFFQET